MCSRREIGIEKIKTLNLLVLNRVALAELHATQVYSAPKPVKCEEGQILRCMNPSPVVIVLFHASSRYLSPPHSPVSLPPSQAAGAKQLSPQRSILSTREAPTSSSSALLSA